MADKHDRSNLEAFQCRIDGMDCPDCAAKFKKVVGEISGVAKVRVNFTGEARRLKLYTFC